MIYQTISIKYQISSIKRQEGVTLLLAILVLSAVMAISFSLATILLVEVRVSGDLLRTEPALYAANSVTEEALFAVGRGYSRCTPEDPANPTSDCANQFYYTTSLGTVNMKNPQPTENSFNDPILRDKVLVTSNTIANTQNRYAFYNPNDINQPGYYLQTRVTFIDTGAGGQIHVYVCQFKAPVNFNPTDPPVDCNNAGSADMVYQNTTPLNEGLSTPIIALDPSKQQELIIYTTGGDQTKDRFIQIEAFGPDSLADSDTSPDPKGIPFFGETVVDINAEYGGVTRALRVKIPEQKN